MVNRFLVTTALIKIIETGEDHNKLNSVVYRNADGKVVWNKDHPLIQDPDSIPFPAYDLLEVEKYFTSPKRTAQSPVYISKRILPILTSRGCPLKCVFCHDTLGKTFRHRSPENTFGRRGPRCLRRRRTRSNTRDRKFDTYWTSGAGSSDLRRSNTSRL